MVGFFLMGQLGGPAGEARSFALQTFIDLLWSADLLGGRVESSNIFEICSPVDHADLMVLVADLLSVHARN